MTVQLALLPSTKPKLVRDSRAVLSATVGTNADVFPDILSLYAKEGDMIADVTYGKGVFWKNVDVSQYTLLATDLATDGVDCRKLPYDDGSLDMVVLDPPYLHTPGTIKASIAGQYRNNEMQGVRRNSDILQLYYDAMLEAHRVLKDGGFLVVKCQDTIESGTPHWNHVTLFGYAAELGFVAEDLFIVVQPTQPAIRWAHQLHARKNHSYFIVARKP